MRMQRYADRAAAGQQLGAAVATAIGGRAGDARFGAPMLVLGLPRGGIPVAVPVAARLRAPLDAFCVRKVGVPWQPELAMAAVASGDRVIRNDDVISRGRIAQPDVEAAIDRELLRLHATETALRGDRPAPELAGRLVVLVDDGIATGASVRAAVDAVRHGSAAPAAVVVAVPAAPRELPDLGADLVVCPLQPRHFSAVGAYYVDFTQVSDDEVRRLLAGQLS
jgi:putative phosphoribosyl transferase